MTGVASIRYARKETPAQSGHAHCLIQAFAVHWYTQQNVLNIYHSPGFITKTRLFKYIEHFTFKN